MGNDGRVGFQTGGEPGNAIDAMTVASIDSLYKLNFYIIAPDNTRIFYEPGTASGGWTTSINSKIYING